jgi:hypothetical protein
MIVIGLTINEKKEVAGKMKLIKADEADLCIAICRLRRNLKLLENRLEENYRKGEFVEENGR